MASKAVKEKIDINKYEIKKIDIKKKKKRKIEGIEKNYIFGEHISKEGGVDEVINARIKKAVLAFPENQDFQH